MKKLFLLGMLVSSLSYSANNDLNVQILNPPTGVPFQAGQSINLRVTTTDQVQGGVFVYYRGCASCQMRTLPYTGTLLGSNNYISSINMIVPTPVAGEGAPEIIVTVFQNNRVGNASRPIVIPAIKSNPPAPQPSPTPRSAGLTRGTALVN